MILSFFIVTQGKASLPASFTDDFVRKLQYATSLSHNAILTVFSKVLNFRGDADAPIFVSALRPRQLTVIETCGPAQ